jgi:hypothetical protein
MAKVLRGELGIEACDTAHKSEHHEDAGGKSMTANETNDVLNEVRELCKRAASI